MSGVAPLTWWGNLSALSSYEDAFAEAVYEELDYLVTQKEGLLGSPGGCLCLPSWDLWVCTFSQHLQTRHVPQVHRGSSPKWQDGLSQPRVPPASVYTAKSVPSLLTFNIGPVGVGGSFCVLCDVFLHFRLPVRW